MDHNIYLYSAAALLAAGTLAYLVFGRRGAWLEKPPAKDSAFAKFGPGIRLRDLFRMAVAMEEQGRDLYRRLGEKAASPGTRKLCAWLADQEVDHARLYQDQLDRWQPLHPHQVEWPRFVEKVKQEGFFADPPGPAASETELAAFALGLELKSIEFYSLFERSFPEAWKRARINRLVEEERAHAAELRAAYPSL